MEILGPTLLTHTRTQDIVNHNKFKQIRYFSNTNTSDFGANPIWFAAR